MQRQIIDEIGKHKVILMDSITSITDEDEGHIIISGSHGGKSAGYYAAKVHLAGGFFNDAGVGKDSAGIAALTMLDESRVPSGAVSAQSARIGDAQDTWDSGVLSHINESARERGLREGELLRHGVQRAFSQDPPSD